MNNKLSKIKCIAIFLAGISTASIPAVAHATLESRLGGQAFYDTDLDISWLADTNLNGNQTWQTQMTWTDNLIIAGTDGWRLPSVGELYYLFSVEQIRHPFMGIGGHGPFTNISWTYWTNHSFDNHLAYKFEFSDFWGDPSLLKIALKSHTALAAWAVHDGDVGPAFSAISAIPEPETYAMLLAGLGLVGFMARRRKDSAV